MINSSDYIDERYRSGSSTIKYYMLGLLFSRVHDEVEDDEALIPSSFFSMVLHSRRRINRSSWKREGERDHTKEKEAKEEKYTISSVPGLTSCMEDIVLEPSFFFFFFLPFSLKALTCFVRLRLLAVQTSTNKQPKKRGLLRLAEACQRLQGQMH